VADKANNWRIKVVIINIQCLLHDACVGQKWSCDLGSAELFGADSAFMIENGNGDFDTVR
jgi:hypothetical protein